MWKPVLALAVLAETVVCFQPPVSVLPLRHGARSPASHVGCRPTRRLALNSPSMQGMGFDDGSRR